MPPAEISSNLAEPDFSPPFESMQYLQSIQWIFSSPKWAMNVLLTAVGQMIPVIGPIAVTGYRFEVIEALHLRPLEVYPEFDFNRFMEYLKRGVWVFLVELVAMTVIWMVMGVLMIVPMIFAMRAADAAGGNEPGAEFVIFMGIAWLAGLCVMVAYSMVIVPMHLRAGLMQDFAPAFDLKFIREFLSLVWWETFLAALFLGAMAIVGMLVGVALCGIGMFFVAPIIVLAWTHLEYQLYELYLSRGGEPIPLKTSGII